MSDINNGEEIADQFLEGVEIEEEEADVAKYEIFSYPADTTLSGYYDLWQDDELFIPDFQRNYIWDMKRASKLIESFLLGIPVPNVFLYLPKDKDKKAYWVIDGQQRIKSIISFIYGEFIDGQQKGKTFILRGLDNPKWNNKSFENLDKIEQARLKRTVLRSIIIQQIDENDNRSIHYIFERLNTGGMILNAMEVRMCVSLGVFADTLKKLNELPIWRDLIKKPIPDKRFRDMEWILRAIALHDNYANYDSPMKAFLDDYMHKHQNESKEWLDGKILLFENALKKAASLDDNPFHIAGWSINLSVMDSIIVALMSIDGQSIDEEKLKIAYQELIQEDLEYQEDPTYYGLVTAGVGTTNRATVQLRIELAKEKFNSICG